MCAVVALMLNDLICPFFLSLFLALLVLLVPLFLSYRLAFFLSALYTNVYDSVTPSTCGALLCTSWEGAQTNGTSLRVFEFSN